MPATLNLAVGDARGVRRLHAGSRARLPGDDAATVTSTAADALLTVADPSATATGHLVNGAFALPQALQANASSAGGMGGDYAAIGGWRRRRSCSPTRARSATTR